MNLLKGYKNHVMRVINLILYLGSCVLLGSGLMLYYRLPSGSGNRLEVLGLSRHEWGDVHYWVALAMVVAAVAHLVLNWRWLQKIASASHLWRLVAGLVLGAMIVASFFLLPVEENFSPGGGSGAELHETTGGGNGLGGGYGYRGGR